MRSLLNSGLKPAILHASNILSSAGRLHTASSLRFVGSSAIAPAMCRMAFSTTISTSHIFDHQKSTHNSEIVRAAEGIVSLLGREIGDNKNISAKMALFFGSCEPNVKGRYDGVAVNFILATREAIIKALDAAEDKNEAKKILSESFKSTYYNINNKQVWNFCNLTSRASHLYRPNEEGGLSFEEVNSLVQAYNRYGLTRIAGGNQNSVFILLCHSDTREKIINGEISPREALGYAVALNKDDRVQNPLSDIAEEVFYKNSLVITRCYGRS